MVVQSLPLLLLVFISCAFANIANSSSSIPSLPARSFGFKFSVPVPQADDFDRLLSERSQAQAPDVSATSLPTLPNIGFLGSGYDLVAGNPETTNGDPGYRPARIFAASYTNQTTSDGRFLIFDGMDAIQRRTCSYDSECSEIHGETSYTNTLSCHVSVSASAGWSGFLSGSFSASSDYSSVSSSAYKDHEVSYLAKAVCTEYEASIQAFNPPPFSSNFLHAITKLVGTRTTNTNSTPICEKIVSSFGTHVITTVTMGSMFIVRSTFSDQSWSSLLDQKVDISLAARGSLKLFTGDASAGGSSALHAAQSFEAARSTFFSSFIGSRPSTDGKWETWAATTAESPHPVNHMTLMPLSDLVTPENFPEFSPGEVIAAAESLRSFIENWCQYNGGGERCTPKPDRSPTVTFTQSNSATDQVAFPCKSGLLLAAGFSARHGAVGPSHAAAPAFFAGNDGAAHCVAPSEVVECTALCSTGVTNVHRVWSPVVRGLVRATCPPGYLVASCSYLAAGGDEPFPLAYPSDPRSCSCYNYYGAQCGASCVPEAEVKAHEIVSRYGVGDFAASCPAGKRLLGCGYSREVAGQQEVYWRVAPASNTACRCYNYFGATCHAVCAQY